MINRRITQLLAVLSALLIVGGPNVSAITLGEALDNTNLVWTTPGTNEFGGLDEVIWLGVATNAPALTFDGLDAAMNATTGDSQKSSIETIVTGPGVISFWWKVDSEDGFDFLSFFVDREQETGSIFPVSGIGVWEFRSYSIGNGQHTLSWVFDRDGGGSGGSQSKVYLDQVKFTTGPEIPLGTALNTTYATWSTGGNDNPTFWTGQTNVSHADGKAAESGAITTGQESSMETTVFGVTNVSFWWKVSSTTNLGLLRFYTNNVQLFQISGEVGWQLKTNIAIPIGTNTLRWTTTNDVLAIGGLTRGWVDEVQFSPTFTPPSIMLSTPVLTNGPAQFTVTNKIGWPCKVFYSTNLADNTWTLLLATNTTLSATVNVTDPGATNSPSRFYRAQSP